MKKRLIFCLASLFVIVQLQAQTAKDALRFLELEQFNKASEAFASLVEKEPAPANLFYAGYFYLKIDEADKAKPLFDKAVAENPKFALGMVGQGAFFLAKKDKVKGKELIDAAIKLSKGKDAEVLFRAGEAYIMFETKDHPEAIALLNNAAKLRPKDAEILIVLGDAYMIPNDASAAATNYDRATRLNPNIAKPYIKLGNTYIRAKSYQVALDKYLEGLAKEPDYWPGYRQLGELYFLAQKYKDAVAAYRKYIENTDNTADAQYKFGAFLYLTKEYEEALKVLAPLAGKVSPKYQKYWQRVLAYCQFENKLYEEGIANMRVALASLDTAILATDYQYYGKLLIESGQDTTEGLNQFVIGTSKDTTSADLLSEYGDVFLRAKRYGRAAEALELAIANGKTASQDYFNYGNSLFYGKNFAKADTVYDKVIELAPNSAAIYYQKARTINFRKLDSDLKKGLAKPYYEKFIELNDKSDKYKRGNVEALEYLGYYYTGVQKDKGKADDYWKQLLAIDPDNQKAKNGLLIK